MTIELAAVDDAATRGAARDLIAEYLRWIASLAAASYGLSFDIDAMVTSDIEDPAKFYKKNKRGEPPTGAKGDAATSCFVDHVTRYLSSSFRLLLFTRKRDSC